MRRKEIWKGGRRDEGDQVPFRSLRFPLRHFSSLQVRMITLHLAWRAFVVIASRVQCSSFALLQFESIRCNVAGKSLCRCSLFITRPSSPSRAVLPTLLVIIINPVVIFVHTAFVGCSCIPSGARPPPQDLRRHGRQVLASKHLKGRRRRQVSKVGPKNGADPQHRSPVPCAQAT